MTKFTIEVDKYDTDRCHIYRLNDKGKPWLYVCTLHVDDVVDLFGEVVLELDAVVFSIDNVNIYPEGDSWRIK